MPPEGSGPRGGPANSAKRVSTSHSFLRKVGSWAKWFRADVGNVSPQSPASPHLLRLVLHDLPHNRCNRYRTARWWAKCCQKATSGLLLATPQAMVVRTQPTMAAICRASSKYPAVPPRLRDFPQECPVNQDNREMMRSMAFLALTLMVLGTSGCGCCRNMVAKKQPCPPQPVYQQCAPVCAPQCQTCDPCGNTGGVTYNYGGTPAMMMPQSFEGMQMMAPSSGCSTCAQ